MPARASQVASKKIPPAPSGMASPIYALRFGEYFSLHHCWQRRHTLLLRFNPLRYASLGTHSRRVALFSSAKRPFGLFVSKLDVNIGGVNKKIEEMRQLFEREGIELLPPVRNCPRQRSFCSALPSVQPISRSRRSTRLLLGGDQLCAPEGVEVSVVAHRTSV